MDVASLCALDEGLATEAGPYYPLLGELLPSSVVVRATFMLQDALNGARQGEWGYADALLRAYG